MTVHLGQFVDDRHRVDSVLGQGGFATVYAGTDTVSGRPVAIKVLAAGAASAEVRARFAREVRTIAKLRDPHTVTLYAHGVTDGQAYMVFELVGGDDLHRVLHHHGRLAPDVAERVLRQILYSLREAHANGLIHRDIKPENIRIYEYQSDPWCVKVLDFGLGRRFDTDRPQLTAAGDILGTPRYMSPEQLLDQPLTPASDLYSVGLVAFEMLMGSDAVQGGAWADQLARLESGHLFSAPGFGAGELQRVIQKMTARAPEDRYPSVDSVLAALDRQPRVDAAIPYSTVQAASLPAPTVRSRALVAGAGLAAIGAIVGLWSLLPTTDEPRLVTVGRYPVSIIAQADVGAAVPDAPVFVGADAALEPVDLMGDTGPVEDGCGPPPPIAKGWRGVLAEPGLADWFAYIPKSYDPDRPQPLVMLLHQNFNEPGQLLEASGFEAIAEQEKFVVIAPVDEYMIPWEDPHDIVRLAEVVASTKRQLCIDSARVFVVGHSQGGKIAEKLACEPWVHAVATHSHRRGSVTSDCPQRAVPFIAISPRHSGHIPFEGGPSHCSPKPFVVVSVKELESAWLDRNGCIGSRQKSFRYRGTQCWTWECQTPFESCHLDGGHNWPGSKTRAGWQGNFGCDGETADFPSARRIWDFFSSINVPDVH